jgi:hypothetical protein
VGLIEIVRELPAPCGIPALFLACGVCARALPLMALTCAFSSPSSTEDFVQAVDELQGAINTGVLHPGDMTPAMLHACLHTRPCPEVDLVIRTSGETRLSDFLLWQVRNVTLAKKRKKKFGNAVSLLLQAPDLVAPLAAGRARTAGLCGQAVARVWVL